MSLKPYYYEHEKAYQQIKAKGNVGWGNVQSLKDLGDAKTNEYLLQTVKSYLPETKNKKALDVGCGTGTTAFVLNHLGFDVTGIDISSTAIEMAQALSIQLGLNINFYTEDILNPQKSDQFDFVYDSHCLHCVVFEEDRLQTLLSIKKLLKKDGLFVLDTMVIPNEDIKFKENFKGLRFDENFILWHKSSETSEYTKVELDGQYWTPQRRIYPADTVIQEVTTAGYEIIHQQLDHQINKPSMLRLVLK